MDSIAYLNLQRKQNKTELEWELLKAVKALRMIGELVTDATKQEITSEVAIDGILTILTNND